MFPFFKRKVLLIMLLQVNIKDLIIFSAQTPGLSKNTKVLALKKWKIKYENEFFQQKDCDINQRPFFVYKMKIPKKWQFPLFFFSLFWIMFQKVFQKVKIVDFRFSWTTMWNSDPDPDPKHCFIHMLSCYFYIQLCYRSLPHLLGVQSAWSRINISFWLI